MIEVEGEVVAKNISDDDQIRAVFNQFQTAHQETDVKPRRRGPAKKKVEAPMPAEFDDEEEKGLEPGESLPGATFEGMGPEGLDDEDDEPGDLPVKRRPPKPDPQRGEDIWSWYDKYAVGQNPEMDVQLWRVYPKIFPNGVVAEGPLDTFPMPIDESFIASTYGGGIYEVHAMGPGKNGHGRRRYSKFTVKIPGIPDSTKPSALVRDAAGKGEPRMQGPIPVPPSENVGVVQQALKTLEKTSDDAQKRAKVAEDRVIAGATSGSTEAVKIIDLVREDAGKREQLLREQQSRESRQLEERLRDRDRKLNELQGEVKQMQNAAPTLFKEMADALRQPVQAPGVNQEMMNNLLTKHAAEIEAMRNGNAREIEAMHAAHLREIESMRKSYGGDRESDRREAAAREQRIVDQLEQAREERRRDNEMHKQMQEQRDTASHEREKSRVDLVETMWQSRMHSAEESASFRVNSLSAELERLRGELADLRSKAREDGDAYAQIEHAKQLLNVARDSVGGGLGDVETVAPVVQQGGQKNILDQVMEYGPAIGKMVTDLVGADAGKKKRRQQQPMPPMGSVVNTPQGRMVVTPQGFIPEYLYAQTVASQQHAQPRMFPQQQRQQVPMQQQPMPQQPMPQNQQRAPQQTPQARRTSRPPDDALLSSAPPAPVEHVVVAPNIYEAQEQMEGAKEPLSGTAASFVAKALNDGLNEAMEVDEFIDEIRKKVPETYLQDLVKYTAAEVLASVQEHAPKSLALSPGGVEFTTAVMQRLRIMYGITA